MKYVIERIVSSDRVELLVGKSYVLNNGKSKDEVKYNVLCTIFSLIVIFYFTLLLGILVLANTDNKGGELKDGYYLEKVQPGEGKKKVKLYKTIDNETEIVTVYVPELYPGDVEANKELNRAEEYIRIHILGENKSVSCIDKPLKLIDSIPDSIVKPRYLTEDNDYINDDGSLNNDFEEDSIDTNLFVELSYMTEVKKVMIQLKIIKKTYSDVDNARKNWNNAIKRSLSKSTDKYVKLPDIIDGKKVTYKNYKENKVKYLCLIFIILIILIPVIYKVMEERKYEKRQKEYKDNYYIIVEKFILYMGAGLSIYDSILRIIKSFEGKDRVGFLLKDLKVLKRETDNGISVEKALTEFGLRSKEVCYMKFVSLIVQNMKKGSEDILKLLEIEAKEAFEEKSRLLMKSGEEASTKLLLPMVGMLIIVMVIIMKAAFQSM
ncbi:MAG: type II secretion system F family protein [Lachnospiraceae bacterium]|nr:type II secretion system F family protein [Lachnospiraceae bacterium]